LTVSGAQTERKFLWEASCTKLLSDCQLHWYNTFL